MNETISRLPGKTKTGKRYKTEYCLPLGSDLD